MPVPLYTQTVIAFIWDFDRTLIPGNQQEPLFEAFGVDEPSFWEEVDALTEHYRSSGYTVARDSAYLLHLLSYVKHGPMAGLTNERLRQIGGQIVPSPGIPEFFEATHQFIKERPAYAGQGITVEHYAVSTGLEEMIKGSVIAPFIDGVWANAFIEREAPPGFLEQLDVETEPTGITHVSYHIDNTTKTRAVFEINKGVNKNPSIDVNARMAEEQRRVPIRNMVYIADGPSDVPVFSILNERGGKTLGVYTTEPRNNFRQVKELQEQGRIQGMAEADFREGEAAYLWLMDSLDQIAGEIVEARHQAFADIPNPPGHV